MASLWPHFSQLGGRANKKSSEVTTQGNYRPLTSITQLLPLPSCQKLIFVNKHIKIQTVTCEMSIPVRLHIVNLHNGIFHANANPESGLRNTGAGPVEIFKLVSI